MGCSPQDHLLRLCRRGYRLSPTYLNSSSSRCHLQRGEKADLHTVRVTCSHIQFSCRSVAGKDLQQASSCCPCLPTYKPLSFPLPFLLYLVSTCYQSNPQICSHTSDLAASHTHSDPFMPPGSSPDLSLCFLRPHKP